ncbi:hypothetical protein [Streptomyces prunicolor]
MGDWVRRAAVGYYRANVTVWEAVRRLVVDPNGGALIPLLLLAVTVGWAFTGHPVAAWVTVGAMAVLIAIREMGA